jgi:hypothetical protein
VVLAVPDCPTAGCTARNKPICGSDGNTYQNECFAKCQDVSIVAQGRCTAAAGAALAAAAAAAEGGVAPSSVSAMSADDLGSIAALASSVANGFIKNSARVVTQQDMNRYADDGMVLVGTLRPVDNFKPTTRRLPANVQSIK